MQTIERFDGLLAAYVHRYKAIHRDHVISYDDLMSEVKIAALLAVRSFREDKAAQLKSYVISCVKNRLANIYKSQEYRGDHNFYVEIMEDHCGLTDPDEVDFELHMQKLLTSNEYLFYKLHFVHDYGLKEVSELLGWPRKEARKCFTLIVQKFVESDESLKRKFLKKKPNFFEDHERKL